ncbi:MAG: ABC transporter permease [Actinomycetes bacterium]|jgi:osmoprotectant transport system permease protein|nr:MAG: quaternary ammonium transporter [Actinomycetota bacterium]
MIDWGWIASNLDDIWEATLQHLFHSVLAVGIGLVVSFALSLVALRWKAAYGPITWVTGVLYTIPSIALFTFLVPVFGLTSIWTAQVALVSYTLLILVRNIVAGIRSVPDHVVEASRGMGMTEARIFREVQLPLALPAIIAGVRVAAVTTIGLVTLTVIVGQGGYGLFILRGIGRRFLTEALVGTVGAVLMAVVVDRALVALERAATPWARRRAA